jgi:hypothetical protein
MTRENHKKMLAIFLIVMIIITLSACSTDSATTTKNPEAEPSASSQIKPENDGSANAVRTPDVATNIAEVITDSTLADDFVLACNKIGIDTSKIKNLSQTDDWAGGSRYHFTYERMGLEVYCNANSTVNSININSDTKVYAEGYEPYQIGDYIVDVLVAEDLIPLCEQQVESQLNFPATADFSLLNWAYGRDRSLYYLQSEVSAKNGFGVEDTIPFTLAYDVSEDQPKLVYFNIGASSLIDDRANYAMPERGKIEAQPSDSSSSSAENKIILIDGELGEYGQADPVYGEEYVDFYVPAGKYDVFDVFNDGKFGTVWIVDGEEVVNSLEFSEYGQTGELEISDGQHIELTISLRVTLTPQ